MASAQGGRSITTTSAASVVLRVCSREHLDERQKFVIGGGHHSWLSSEPLDKQRIHASVKHAPNFNSLLV